MNDGLYKSCLACNNFYVFLNVENVVAKHSKMKDRSSMLWHKHLGHITKEIIDRLIKDDILSTLDFGDMETYIDCIIRDKLIKTKKKGAIRSLDFLKIIHTDISGPYYSIIYGKIYFITFIDDFFQYDYLI